MNLVNKIGQTKIYYMPSFLVWTSSIVQAFHMKKSFKI